MKNFQGNTTLVVNKLPINIDVMHLQEVFSQFGNILSAQVENDEYSQTPDGKFIFARAYIEMENNSQAQNAIQALHGSNVFSYDGRSLLQVCLSVYIYINIYITYI